MCKVHLKEVSDAFCDCEDELMDDFQFAVGLITDQIETGMVEILQYPATGIGGFIQQLQAATDESAPPLQAVFEVQTPSGETLQVFHAATGESNQQLQAGSNDFTQQFQAGTGGGPQHLLVSSSEFPSEIANLAEITDLSFQHIGTSGGASIPQTDEQVGLGLIQHIQQVMVAAVQDLAQSEGSAISASN